MESSLTEQIYDRTIEILQLADTENIAVQQAAIRIAEHALQTR